MEERKKNPMKQLAMQLAHAIDDQKRIMEEDLREHQIQEIRAYHSQVIDEIWKKGYDIQTMLSLADEYKTLSWDDYIEWVFN